MNKNGSRSLRKLWNNILVRNIFFAMILVIFLLIFSSIFLDKFTRHGRSAPVPDFTGKSLDSVLIIAKKNSLRIEVVDSVFRIDIRRGSVFKQNPKPNTRVKKNRKIFLTMNSFSPKKEPVPNVKYLSLRLAKTELNTKGFRIGKLEYSSQHSPYTNNVSGMVYGGREIEPGIMLPTGEYIDLKLGLGTDSLSRTTFIVPDVKGLLKQAAEDVIVENSLNYVLEFDKKGIKTITDSLNSVAYEQNPPAGSHADYGEKVRIKLKLPEKSKKK
jgi:beta-lactam-binding protein with PASTA domain